MDAIRTKKGREGAERDRLGLGDYGLCHGTGAPSMNIGTPFENPNVI